MAGATEITLSALGVLIALTGVLIAVSRLVLRNIAELGGRVSDLGDRLDTSVRDLKPPHQRRQPAAGRVRQGAQPPHRRVGGRDLNHRMDASFKEAQPAARHFRRDEPSGA